MWKYFLLNRKNKIVLRKIAWNAETQRHKDIEFFNCQFFRVFAFEQKSRMFFRIHF